MMFWLLYFSCFVYNGVKNVDSLQLPPIDLINGLAKEFSSSYIALVLPEIVINSSPVAKYRKHSK